MWPKSDIRSKILRSSIVIQYKTLPSALPSAAWCDPQISGQFDNDNDNDNEKVFIAK